MTTLETDLGHDFAADRKTMAADEAQEFLAEARARHEARKPPPTDDPDDIMPVIKERVGLARAAGPPTDPVPRQPLHRE